jgi:hypothetical protein
MSSTEDTAKNHNESGRLSSGVEVGISTDSTAVARKKRPDSKGVLSYPTPKRPRHAETDAKYLNAPIAAYPNLSTQVIDRLMHPRNCDPTTPSAQ